MRKLALKLLEERRAKAIEMVGKKIEVQVSTRALSIDQEKKTVVFVMSTCNIDRHGDIIDQDSWMLDHFQKNPAFFLQHRSDNFPIGKWLKVWLEADPDNVGKQRLVGEAEFRVKYEDAARAFDHVVEGDLNMVSVGFIPHRVDYDEERDAFILYDCELLECSLVGIGSNRQALAKDNTIADVKENAIEVAKALDEVIHKANNTEVIAHLKARDTLYKAIRRMK
jgi:HK97 family phage prohead protease